MKTNNTVITLQAQTVDNNHQVVNINCSLCHEQLEDIKKETAFIKRVLMENRRLLQEIMRVLERKKSPLESPASLPASVALASVSASAGAKNIEISTETNI